MNTAIIKPGWSPLTIALMVLGFIFFWPVGLAVLAYILWGEYFGGTSEQADRYWSRAKGWCSEQGRKHKNKAHHGFASSGNAAFDAYREEQLRRLDEERRRLDEEISQFHEYLKHLREARDREEFDRFMRERNHRPREDRGSDEHRDDDRRHDDNRDEPRPY